MTLATSHVSGLLGETAQHIQILLEAGKYPFPFHLKGGQHTAIILQEPRMSTEPWLRTTLCSAPDNAYTLLEQLASISTSVPCTANLRIFISYFS